MSGMTGMIGNAFNPSGTSNSLNQLPIGMDGQVLTGNEGLSRGIGAPTSDPREMDGTFNTPTPQVGIGGGGMPPGDAGVGMGGKGGMPMPMPGGGAPGMGGKGGGGPLAQIPIDMNGNLLGGGQPPMPVPEPTSMGGLPPAPNAQMPLGRVSGGTLGRPSASAPMVPRGPGLNNPGAPGNPPPQPPERGMLTPPQGPQNRLQPAPAAPAAPIVSQRARVPRQAPVSMKGGMARGAGRGGMLR